jgi:hypothetical protein
MRLRWREYVAGAEVGIHVCSKQTSVLVSSRIFIGPAQLLSASQGTALALHVWFSLYYICVYILRSQ